MDPTQIPQDPSQMGAPGDDQEGASDDQGEMSLDDAVGCLEEYEELQKNPKLLKQAHAALAASKEGAPPPMSNGAPGPKSIADLKAMSQAMNARLPDSGDGGQ